LKFIRYVPCAFKYLWIKLSGGAYSFEIYILHNKR
jgi:hypothetical protein